MKMVEAQRKQVTVTKEDAAAALALKNEWLDFTQSLQTTFMTVILAMAPAIKEVTAELTKGAQAIGGNKAEIRQFGEAVAKFVREVDFSSASKNAMEFAGTIGSIATSIKDMLDRWDEWTGKKKADPNRKGLLDSALMDDVKTPGVLKLPGGIRLGSAAALAEDNKKTGLHKDDKAEQLDEALRPVTNVFSEVVARTLASMGHKPSAVWIRETTGKDDYLTAPGTRDERSSKAALRQEANFQRRQVGLPELPELPSKKAAVERQAAGEVASTAKYIKEKLMAKGWSAEQASGITASFQQESDLDPSRMNSKSGAYGLGQWLSKDRVANFKAFAGRDLKGSSLDQQIDFFHHEVTKGSEIPAGDKLRATRTAEDAARIHSTEYERPGADEANIPRRQRLAAQIAMDTRQQNALGVTKMPAGAPAAAPVTNTNTKTSTSTTEVNGPINIYPKGGDPATIAKGIKPAIERYTAPMQANTGMN